ncbi:pyridoxamine 5'-phosphate oxidase family protein [Streptomyces incanus]
MRLRGTVPVGRILCTRRALPAVLPVDFGLDGGGSVLLCAAEAAEPVRAIDGAVVAFGADDGDAARQAGWSAVVTGPATVVTDPAEHECLARTGPVSRAPAARAVLVRIESGPVTGRELVTGRALYGVAPTA